MDKPHLQVVTSYPVAIKYGQGRVHVPNPIPWHAQSETIKCPHCETIFVVTTGFPRVDFLNALETDHKNEKEHPDYIASALAWTRTTDCDCHF
jgi:hypothetical protein